jgi:hypothetical protein
MAAVNGIAPKVNCLAIKKAIAPARLQICASLRLRRRVKRLWRLMHPITLNGSGSCHA